MSNKGIREKSPWPQIILVLSLFKQSPKAYKFLAKIFCLTSRIKLANFLKPIITICNQVSNNVSALNSLIKLTKFSGIQKKEQLGEGYFEMIKFKVNPIFDPPSPFKYMK